MYFKPLVKGLISFIPGFYQHYGKNRSGGTDSARYCYSVWLRHLTMAYKNGLLNKMDSIAELGPGDSLGIGLAAIISGVNQYYALDIVKYGDVKKNIEIFDELVELFKRREKIPDETEFPQVKPVLDSYDFPSHVLTNERLGEAMKQKRLETIKSALEHLNEVNVSDSDIEIKYVAPWYDPEIIREGSVDFIYSQAVLEHIDELESTYQALYHWLKPDGLMAHTIDFGCHKTAKVWNGHWAYSDLIWRLIRGRRPFLLNRQPHSQHIYLMRKCGFQIVCDLKNTDNTGIQRGSLIRQLKEMGDEDLVIRTAYIQAIKE